MFGLALFSGLAPVLAQYTEDEQTQDHEQQDRRYYERYRQQLENEPAEPSEADDPQAVREAFLARAEELIRDPSYRAHTSDHYRVQTDDPRVSPKQAATLLESFRTFFDEFWSSRLAMQPYEPQSRVFLFFSFYKFNQLLTGDWRFSNTRPKGHYRYSVDVITLHTDADGARNLADALVHEAAHQLVEQRIYSAGFASSPWVAEGLASYFGYTYFDRDGVFQPGQIGGKSVSPIKDAPRTQTSESKQRLASLKGAMKASKSEDVRITDVVAIVEPGVFYGSQVQFSYPASWVLVHFLFHGDDGAHAEAFVRYIEREALGHGGPRAFFSEIGMSADELEAALVGYLKRLKTR